MTSHDPSLTPDTVKYPGSETGLAGLFDERLTLGDLAAAVMSETDRRNTLDAYAQDWARWTEFVASVNAAGMDLAADGTATRSTQAQSLIVFARWLSRGGLTARGNRIAAHAPESIRRRITGVLAGWREMNVDYPRAVSHDARRWVDDHENKLVAGKKPTGRGQAPAVRVDQEAARNELVRIVAAADEAVGAGDLQPLARDRDIALITMAVAVGGRSAEMAFLDVADITPGERGVYVHIRQSKKGTRKPAVTYGQRDITCPVLAWRRWQEASGVTDGAAIRRVDRHGKLGGRMSAEACSDAVRRAGLRAGLPGLTVHSCRAGFATAATRAGQAPHDIAAQGGWSPTSAAMHGYIRSVQVWNKNVLDGIGL